MAGGKGGNLGKASLVLTTKDGGLKRGLGSATSSITSWASGVKGKVAGALGVVSGLLAGFAGSKLVGNLGDLAGVGKQAAALGIASDTFMGLGAAAKEAGIEQEQFGNLIQKAQLKIAEGSDETGSALARMGMKLGDLRGKNPADIFFAVARGLEGVGDSGTKALIASKLFEEEGVKLLPVFAKGEQGLRDYVAQMKAMGVALDGEQMGQVMKAQASITKIEQRAKGFWNKLTVFAAPWVEMAVKIGGDMLDWLPTFDKVENAGVGMLRAIGIAGAYTFDLLRTSMRGLSAGGDLWNLAWGKMKQLRGDADAQDMIDKARTNLGQFSLDMHNKGIFENVEKVRKYFDNAEWKVKGEELAKPLGNVLDSAPAKLGVMFAAALEKGTREEYSARIRFQAGAMNVPAQQLAEAKKTTANTAATTAAVNKLADRYSASGSAGASVKVGVIR